SALTVEIHSKTSLMPAASSLKAATIARSAPIGEVRLLVVRLGAVTRRALSRRWSPVQVLAMACFGGGWPVTLAAPAKAGALIRLILCGASRFQAMAVPRLPVGLLRR